MTLPTKSRIPAKAEGPGPTLATEAIDGLGKESHRGKLRQMGNAGRFAWPVVCLFQLGLVAGVYFSRTGNGSAPTSGDAAEPAAFSAHDSGTEKHSITSAHHSLPDTAQADDFLKRGWYEHALTRYEASAEGRTGDLPISLRFKVALCRDGLGEWDRAIAEYGEIAGLGENDQISAAARLARARLWFRMRNLDESKRALCELLLQSTPEGPTGTTVIPELSRLLGLTLAMNALGTEAPEPKRESTLALPALDSRPESQFTWTEPAANGGPRKPTSEARVPGSLDVWPTGPAIQDCDVTVTAQRGTLTEIIRRVADSANATCVWTDAARASADRRTTEISTGRLPWPLLLASLTEPLLISWELRDEKLYLCNYGEIGAEDCADRRAKIAKLILLAAAREGNRSPEAGIAYLGLGNLSFAEDELETAVSWFERFTKEFPRSAHCVQAHFNLGVVRRTLGELAEARTSFFQVVDTAPAHPLVPLSHLFVGRVHLDEGDFEGAVAPLRRAATMAVGTDTRPAAVIDLATALLLVENWRAASALLLEHHALLDLPEFRPTVAFLGTYARYLALADRKLAHREGQALVSALMGIQSGSALPASGVLLVGRAFAGLGLSEQMAETFEQAKRQGISEPIAHEISHELAEFAHTTGKNAEATKHYAAVFKNARPSRSRHAGMRMAEIALDDQRPDDCLRLCRQLLADAEKSEIPVILRLMGKAFEKSGDHKHAAQCFAGQCPAP
jgi:tetratricopeptide (TPR) repeat protein